MKNSYDEYMFQFLLFQNSYFQSVIPFLNTLTSENIPIFTISMQGYRTISNFNYHFFIDYKLYPPLAIQNINTNTPLQMQIALSKTTYLIYFIKQNCWYFSGKFKLLKVLQTKSFTRKYDQYKTFQSYTTLILSLRLSSVRNCIYGIKNSIIIILISGTHMEDIGSISYESLDTSSDKNYLCPCGKQYKSYPAIFTHIKNKHNGKAPGNIKKPNLPAKKRGRPPANKTNSSLGTNLPENNETQTQLFSSQVSISFAQKDEIGKECIESIVKIIRYLPKEPLNKSHLNQVASILQMNVYLVSKGNNPNLLSIGNILAQFLNSLSSKLQWNQFQKVYTLIMLLVQYVIDQLNNNKIIIDGPIDLLCDYINDFLQIGVQTFLKNCQIEVVGIFDSQNMVGIFQAFFQWIMVKKYTNYKISLNQNFKEIDSLSQF